MDKALQLATDIADDFYSAAPKYRTKKNLIEILRIVLEDESLEKQREEILEILLKIQKVLPNKSTENVTKTMEYISPAEKLRREAKNIEYRDQVIDELRQLIASIKKKEKA